MDNKKLWIGIGVVAVILSLCLLGYSAFYYYSGGTNEIDSTGSYNVEVVN